MSRTIWSGSRPPIRAARPTPVGLRLLSAFVQPIPPVGEPFTGGRVRAGGKR